MFASAAIAHLLAVMSPGPDTAIIFHQALAKGRSSGVLTALGIGFGIFIHCLFAISGISLLIYSTEEARFIVQCAGASYLLYLGASYFLIKQNMEKMFTLEDAKSFLAGQKTLAGKKWEADLQTALVKNKFLPSPVWLCE